MMKRLLLALLLLLASGAASAEWTAIDSADHLIIYVDRATIRRNGNLVKMWSMADYKKAQVIDGQYGLSSRSQSEYDCKEEMHRNLALAFFSGQMGSGTVNSTGDGTLRWRPVAPGSIAEALWEVACGKK